MSQSTRKDSLSSASTSFGEGAVTPPSPAAGQAPRDTSFSICGTWYSACAYPPTSAYRRPYLAARALNAVLAFLAFGLAFARPREMSGTAVMTPCMTTAWQQVIDIYLILCCHQRGHPLVRLFYDGVLLGTGVAVAVGFLTASAVPVISSRPDTLEAGVAAVILFCMYTIVLIQYAMGVNGLLQWREFRREQRGV